jgi:CheY-like chemotaxis protein
MPVMDGYEATRIIRELRPGLPIIAQTAYAIGNENEMVDSMFDDYITKPIYKDILLRKMSRFAQ